MGAVEGSTLSVADCVSGHVSVPSVCMCVSETPAYASSPLIELANGKAPPHSSAWADALCPPVWVPGMQQLEEVVAPKSP